MRGGEACRSRGRASDPDESIGRDELPEGEGRSSSEVRELGVGEGWRSGDSFRAGGESEDGEASCGSEALRSREAL